MPAISHRLLIAAMPEEVYTALNEPEGLSAWWTPKVIASGNSIKFHFGEDYHKEMDIIAQKPYTEITWRCIAGADEWIGTTIHFRLESFDLDSCPEMLGQWEQLSGKSNVTLLAFTHSGWTATTQMFAECSYTWALFLRSLKLYCETGYGIPWPNQHHI